jgi:hypothetical protein
VADGEGPSGAQPHDPYVELRDAAVLQRAVEERVAGREHRDRALELATWTGTLRDLAERGTSVVVALEDGLAHRGRLLAVGVDHVALALDAGGVGLLALDAVRSVRPEPGTAAGGAMGDRARSQDRTLIEAVDLHRSEHRELTLGIRGAMHPIRGSVVGLGEDVLSLRVSDATVGAYPGVVYLPTAAIREVVLP